MAEINRFKKVTFIMKYDYQKEIVMNWINRIIRRPLNVKKINPKVWILFVGTFLTAMCAVHLWKAYSQQKQNWNEQKLGDNSGQGGYERSGNPNLKRIISGLKNKGIS